MQGHHVGLYDLALPDKVVVNTENFMEQQDQPEKIDHRLVQLAQIMAKAKTPAEYAKIAVRNGADPRYVAHRYLPIAERERFVKACEEWKERQTKRAGE